MASPNGRRGDAIAVSSYVPIVARHRTVRRPLGPIAFDCVRVAVVRDGSAFLYSDFGHKIVAVGDVIVLGANTLCRCEPEGPLTVTIIDLDSDYLIDQAFWQRAGVLHDRLDAEGFVRMIYSEPTQVLRLGSARTSLLLPWLDELACLSIEDRFVDRFNRMQALEGVSLAV